MKPRVSEHENESREQLQQALGAAYEIERELGRGGMATVYLAHDRKHDRPVALKVLHPDLGAALGSERFRREIRLAAQLQHPHILPVFDSGDAAGQLWYTMPYVAGESLRDRLVRERQLPVDEAVRIVREAAQGLHYAHKHRVVHRDVKPENILLTEDGTTLVADFGIARAMAGGPGSGPGGVTQLTGTGLAIGTPAYMSPEQGAGERDIDARSDVYSLGAVLYELLAGEPPFTGATPQAILAKRFATPAPSVRVVRPGVSPALETVLARALATAPADRFSSAGEFSAALAASVDAVNGAGAPNRTRLLRSVGVAVAVAFVSAALWRWSVSRQHFAESDATSTRKLLAVLPFKHVGAPSEAYFAEGMTEELTTKLASLSGLGVISRTSTDQYRATTKTLAQIAKELGVDYVLEGSVRWDHTESSSGRVRVTPQLIRVSDDTHLWAEDYDADVTKVFDVQAQIADRVAAALSVAIQGRERGRLVRVPTTSFKAYDFFLRGLQREDDHTPRGTLDALALYDSAVALDPTFARVHAFRYYLHERFYRFGWDHTESRRAMARAALEAGLRAGPDDPDVLTAAAEDAMVRRGDLVEAAKLIESLLRDYPSFSGGWVEYWNLQTRRGDWAASLASIRRVVELDPNVALFAQLAAEAHANARRYTDAERYYERAVALNPDNPAVISDWAAMQARHLGDTLRARRRLQDAIERFGIVRTVTEFPREVLFALLSPAQQDSLARSSPVGRSAGDSSAMSRAHYYAWKTRFFHWKGDSVRARAYADSTRAAAEALRHAQPGDAAIAVGMAQWIAYGHAVRGRSTDAIAEAERGISTAHQLADTNAVIDARRFLALIYTMVGDHEHALDELRFLLTVPSAISRTALRTDPVWAGLRDQPRFIELTRGYDKQ